MKYLLANSSFYIDKSFSLLNLKALPRNLVHDKDIKRYFMSIEEAAHLTLKSAILNAGDVHVFDMGEPILLSKIVENLQEVIGLRTSIIITGLRDGEKNSEILFSALETPKTTLDPKISFVSLKQELESNENFVSSIKSRDEKNLLYEIKKYTKSVMS